MDNYCHRCHTNKRPIIKIDGEEDYMPILCNECSEEVFGSSELDNPDAKKVEV